ncbi:MAG: purine-nucleoside phosphorylase [Epsilonproteobacteria bacterium]|nr:purine-nucleoside phosphorylase [Campylobacterota bacterium]
MIVCAGNNENFSFATPIGVGLIESAINLSRICLMNPPEFILFIGTAGSYGKKEIFEIVESRVASNIEHSFLLNTAYTPIDNVVSAAEDVSRETIINSSNYITKSKEISKKYLSLNIELENMEFFSVISVAREFNIPVGGVFIVTNYCFENAHKEFLKNHNEAKKRLEEYLRAKEVIR